MLLCVVLLAGCATTPEVQSPPPSIEATLRPGLSKLETYDYGTEMAEGVRWLEHFAIAQPTSESGRRARFWILKARLDWLTYAYVHQDRDARLMALDKLARHLDIPLPDGVNQQVFDAVLESLQDQVEGLARLPGYEDAAKSADELLALFRNLDRNPAYFQAAKSGLSSATYEPYGRSAFHPNVVLVSYADVGENLPRVANLESGRLSHGLASVLAFECPVGWTSYAKSTLETRLAPLREHCSWSCVESAGKEGTCDGHTRQVKSDLYSVDNEVIVSSLQTLQNLEARVAEVSSLQGPTWPLVDSVKVQPSGAPAVLTLELPNDNASIEERELPKVAFLHTEPFAGIIVSVDKAQTWVGVAPSLVRRDGLYEVEGRGEKVGTYPGQASESVAEVTEALVATRTWLAKESKIPTEALKAENLRPQVLVSADTPVARLLETMQAMKATGHSHMHWVLHDLKFGRSGVLVLNLVSDTKSKSAAVVTLSSDALSVRSPGQRRAKTLKRAEGMPLTELYSHLLRDAISSPSEQLAEVVLSLESGTCGEMAELVDSLRFYRKVPTGASGKALLKADVQEDGGVPKAFSYKISVLVPDK